MSLGASLGLALAASSIRQTSAGQSAKPSDGSTQTAETQPKSSYASMHDAAQAVLAGDINGDQFAEWQRENR